MNDISKLTLTQTLAALKDKQFSLEQLNQAYLDRINLLNGKLNSFLVINKDSSGIPAGIKDVISTQNMPTTAGSKILSNYFPPYNATAIENLKTHQVSVIGKTNCDEFAQGGSGENSAYGPTKNPWNLKKVPGGSSSGSVAAVAADLCVFALGTDTGGSIRQPSALCGVVGLKPSYGRVSRYGLIAMASSLDQIGPITKSVEDAALVLDWISGPDGYDANCKNDKFTLNLQNLKSGVKGLRVGVPKEYFDSGLDPAVKKVIIDALNTLEDLGAKLIDISLPHSQYALAAYYIIVPSEVSSNMARYDGIRFGKKRSAIGPEVKRRIILGTFALSTGYYDEYFAKASQIRTLIKQDFDQAFAKVDVIAGPVSPTVAWDIGEKVNDPLKMYLSDIYTISANLAGIPGLSVPCGFVDNLPVGLQILGKHWDEATILKAGFAYEQASSWSQEKPKL